MKKQVYFIIAGFIFFANAPVVGVARAIENQSADTSSQSPVGSITSEDYIDGKKKLEILLGNSVLPRKIIQEHDSGFCVVTFHVDTLNKVSDVKALIDYDCGCAESVAATVRGTSGKWKYFYKNDKKIPVNGKLLVKLVVAADREYRFKLLDRFPYEDGFQKGLALLKKSDFENAKLYFDSCLISDYENIDVRFNRAITLFKMQRKEEACADLDFALRSGDQEAAGIYESRCRDTHYDSTRIFSIADTMPQYSGGEKALLKFISDNLKYPLEARMNGIRGRVYVRFVIAETGDMESMEIMRGIGSGCDEEALRVIRMTNGHWKPAYRNGKTVKTAFNISLSFNYR